MKKFILIAMIAAGAGFTADAQKLTQPNPVQQASHPRNVKKFKETAALLTSTLKANDAQGSQTHLTELMRMMNDRGDELVRAKAPKAESDAKYNIASLMKGMLGNVLGNKEGVLNLVAQAEAAY